MPERLFAVIIGHIKNDNGTEIREENLILGSIFVF